MTTLGPFITPYLDGRRRRGEITPKTAVGISHTLAAFARSFGNRPLNQLGPGAVDRYHEQIGQLAASTRRSYLSQVRSFTDWLLAQQHITRDPFTEFQTIHQPTPIPVTLTAEELEKLLVTVPDARARAVVMLEHGMGLRAGEVCRLGTKDWDQSAGVMLVHGKGGRPREMPVPSVVRAALLAYLAEVGERPGPLIRSVSKPWAGLAPKTLSGYMAQWLYDAGIKQRPYDGRGGHALRRTGATEIVDLTGDLRLVQAFLGHEGTGNLKFYIARAELGRLREAMEKRGHDPAA